MCSPKRFHKKFSLYVNCKTCVNKINFFQTDFPKNFFCQQNELICVPKNVFLRRFFYRKVGTIFCSRYVEKWKKICKK